MKTVKLIGNVVQEIIPDYALPVEKWYGEAFAAQCVEAPDEVEQGWVYDAENGTFAPPDTAINLKTLKADRITETKAALSAYLAEHPLLWTDGKHYSVTAEKQALLNNAIAVYQIGVQAGTNPILEWNATTEECTEWAFADLCALALAIAAYVKPLVAHQQALEGAIRAAETPEEVQAIEIDYAAIG